VPTIVAYAYQAKKHYFDNKSLIIHNPRPELSTAENFLHMIRPDNKYTDLEAKVLDLALVLHAEHGGGNNSAFTTRVVSSTNTDTYSAISAAISSLKGPRHGGANCKVVEMVENFKECLTDINDKDQVAAHIEKLLNKEAFDNSGLVYGMGHAVYTLSDPRAVALKAKAEELEGFFDGCIEPFAIQFSEALTKMLFSERERAQGSYLMANANRLQYMSTSQKVQMAQQLLDRGVMTINEARELFNYGAVENGDIRFIRGEYKDADSEVTEVSEEDNDGEE
jgi:citrate synthase